TNSPACVLGAFPARLSLRAFAIVRFSGIIILPYSPFRSATRSVALAWAPVAYSVNACAINLIPPRRGRRSFRRGVFGVDAWRETQMTIPTVNLVFSTVVFAVAAKLYLIPMLDRLEPRSVVLPILLLHALRHLGLMFLASGAVFPGMPVQFAYPAAVGDL